MPAAAHASAAADDRTISSFSSSAAASAAASSPQQKGGRQRARSSRAKHLQSMRRAPHQCRWGEVCAAASFQKHTARRSARREQIGVVNKPCRERLDKGANGCRRKLPDKVERPSRCRGAGQRARMRGGLRKTCVDGLVRRRGRLGTWDVCKELRSEGTARRTRTPLRA